MWWFVGILIWLIGAVVTWFVIQDWDKPKWERAWYCAFWPLVLILYGIHKYHNRKKN